MTGVASSTTSYDKLDSLNDSDREESVASSDNRRSITFGEDVPEGRYTPPEPTGISMGDPVRGIRAPYFGQLGKVVELPVEPEALESESRARVMVIEFEDGTRARLPRANVEVIES